MRTFILRRLLQTIPLLLGISALSFLLLQLAPGDYLTIISQDPQIPQGTIDALRHRFGLDQPWYVQYFIYLKNIFFHFDFGESFPRHTSAFNVLRDGMLNTLMLAIAAAMVTWGLAIPLGVWAAVRKNKATDHLVRVVTLLGHSMPIFWTGMIGLIIFYAVLGLVGGGGRISDYYIGLVPETTGFMLIDAAIAGDWEVFGDALNHLILPASILGYSSMAYITRMTRSFMLDQLGQEYVTTARVKGLSKGRTIWHHAFANIRVQLVTIVALAYGSLLEGAVLIETVFSWPGFGQYITNNMLIGDMNAVMTCVLLVGVIFIALNLLSDALYKIFDPRTR